eukprot:CAMPEP_0203757958 /NCGR_PEP_ID=MMETSP0098-20131031/10779_1 /ASSEMBLY_ACC=CAM_ASM_000208 /TAXON_ID=96639 /ORGANISM=" , Strain NY0313808BC1" /LENGTH=102 /DNA_ID=CAMNT_0050650203 /DNA_START=483 /DNA_END=791 /DNA_ORIENTATION=-
MPSQQSRSPLETVGKNLIRRKSSKVAVKPYVSGSENQKRVVNSMNVEKPVTPRVKGLKKFQSHRRSFVRTKELEKVEEVPQWCIFEMDDVPSNNEKESKNSY